MIEPTLIVFISIVAQRTAARRWDHILARDGDTSH